MISTTNIPGGNKALPKSLQPGNKEVKINSIFLEKYAFDEKAYNLILNCEGNDLGESFEGFFINKENESEGRYKGQVSRVRASEYPYADKILPSGVEIKRDFEIVRMLKNICTATNCLPWFEAEDGKHETIESLVLKMNEDAPFKDVFLNTCLAGREYENKQGYVSYDLFFPKFSRTGIPFENKNIESNASRVYTFNEVEFIKRKKVTKEVNNFEPESGDSDFEL